LVTKLLTKEDITIMETGAVSQHEKKLLRLLKISPRLMAAYKTNQLPSIIRRLINVFVK
jgi:ribosomal protein L10